MRHAILDEDGVVQQLYFDAPPEAAIEVPDFVEPGYRRVDLEYIAPDPDLSALRERRLIDVDVMASRLRGGTPGAPYAEKRDEALEIVRMMDRDEDPNALDEQKRITLFPRLAASVGIEAETLTDAADLILKRYTEEANRDFAIERARLSGKSAIKTATSLAEIDAASQEAISALEAIGQDGG